MKRKSFISAILVLLTIIMLLAGCNNAANTGKTTAATPTPSATGTGQTSEPSTPSTSGSDTTVKLPIVDKPFKVTIWAPNGEGIQKTMKTLSDSEYYKELERRTGVTVEFIHPPIGQQNDSFNLMVASGNYPDIIEIIHPYGYMFPGGYDKAIEEGIILRLNELLINTRLTIRNFFTPMTSSEKSHLPTPEICRAFGHYRLMAHSPRGWVWLSEKTGWTTWV